jgi:hypothetical protein
MQLDKVLGKHRDITLFESINLNSSSAAGASADYEHIIFMLPQPQGAAGTLGDLPINALNVRSISVGFEGAIAGAATNNFTLNFWHRRNGNLLVNTTSATAITAGNGVSVTPASMANILPGALLVISGGTGTTETVSVLSVTPTSFVANFSSDHSGSYTITSAPLTTITYSAGVNETQFVPHQFNVPINQANMIVSADCITIQRVSNGNGMASPSLTVGLDLVPAGIGM